MVMRVFVAGGTGVLGRRLVPQLVARGHQVTATTTSAAKLDLLARLGAAGVVMDGLDAASVGEAVAAAQPDTIVHEMTAISPAHAGKPDIKHIDRWFAGTNRLRTEGTDHLLAAAEAAAVAHFAAQGYASWNGIRTGGWVKTEEDRWTRGRGHHAGGGGGDPPCRGRGARAGGVVLHTAGSTGRAPPTTSSSWCASGSSRCRARRRLQLVGASRRRGERTSWLRRSEGLFDIVNDGPAPASEWLPYLPCAGAKPPKRVPRWLARLLAGEAAVTMMTEGRGFSNAKAKRELG